jgi:hypothetical protein
VRDLRRHPFLTNDGAEPLGTDDAESAKHIKSAAKAELREWGQRIITQNRGALGVQGAVVPVQRQEADAADEQKDGEQGGDE